MPDSPEGHNKALVQGVGTQLEKLGHHADVKPASATLCKLSEAVKEFGGEVVHSAGEDFKESWEGEESATHDRITNSKLPAEDVIERASQKAA